MKLHKSALLFFIFSYSVNSLAQYQLQVKFPSPTAINVNGYHVKTSVNNLVINSVKRDSLRLECEINGNLISKSFVLRTEMNSFVLLENVKRNYKFRLRSNLNMDSVVKLELNNYPEYKSKPKLINVSQDSLVAQILRADFEFEKVNLILDYIENNQVSINDALELCNYLKHDFTKWRVVQLVASQTSVKSDLLPLAEVFMSENYKKQLINIIEQE